MKYYLLTILLLLFVSFLSQGEPVIPEPKFSRLSTENGLSQDSINSLLLDNEGFLWLGTHQGLNRFDGYQNHQINGPNNEFYDVPINHLFQDSKRNLWVSDAIKGVHQYNLTSNTIKHVINLTLKRENQLPQLASHISEDDQGNILFSMDEGIYSYSYDTDKLSAEYLLPDEVIDNGSIVRAHLLSKDILFFGTRKGLYGVVRGSNKPTLITYVPAVKQTIDNVNVKMLYADNNDTLWIGTVEGLYSLSLSQAKQFVVGTQPTPESKLRIKKRNIWQLASFNKDMFYVATDKGLYNYRINSEQPQHIFLPTDSRNFIASDVLKDVVVDSNNNLWIGSEDDGAIYWSHTTTLFS